MIFQKAFGSANFSVSWLSEYDNKVKNDTEAWSKVLRLGFFFLGGNELLVISHLFGPDWYFAFIRGQSFRKDYFGHGVADSLNSNSMIMRVAKRGLSGVHRHKDTEK